MKLTVCVTESKTVLSSPEVSFTKKKIINRHITCLMSVTQVSTDPNTSSVVPTGGDTHVVDGCDTVNVTRQKSQEIKKKESVPGDEIRRCIVT